VSSCPVLRVAADGRELVVDAPVQVTVGRDAGADLNIPHPRISRRHLVLRPGRRGWVLEDVGSTNGTFHEGRRVSLLRIDRPLRLRLGDPDDGVELRLEPDPGTVVQAPAPAQAGDGDRAGDGDQPGDGGGGTAVPLLGGSLRLGRAAGNDVVIRDPTVSGHHAELVGDPVSGFEIVDLGSRNGTFVNGERVGQARLRESDRIGIGYHEFRIRRVGPAGYALVQSVDRAEWWRLAATIAISVLTVLGAGLAFWSAYLGSRAVDDDRRSVMETVQVQQQQVGNDARVRAEASLAAAYRAALAEVEVLEGEAAQARRGGRLVEAVELEDRARLQETVARRLEQFFPAGALEGEGARARFQVEARRRALAGATPQAQVVSQLDPDRTAVQARQARQRSVRLQAWSVALVVVLALLTFARLSEPVRPWLMVSGVLLLVAVAAAAVLTALL
jgi:pSer/pThr/pTyr-binding forkhead associated (FHA) protein